MSYGRDQIEILLNELADLSEEELGLYLIRLADSWWERRRCEDWERALILYYAREKWNDFPWDFKRQFISFEGLLLRLNEGHKWQHLVRAMRALLEKGNLIPHGVDPLGENAYRFAAISSYLEEMDEDDWLAFKDRGVTTYALEEGIKEKYRKPRGEQNLETEE